MTSVAAFLLLALLPWVIGREPHDWDSLEEAQRHERKHELGGFFVRFGEHLKTTASPYLTETARCKCDCQKKCFREPKCYAYHVKSDDDVWICSYYQTVGEYAIEGSTTSRNFFSIKLEIDGWRKGFDDLYYIYPPETFNNWNKTLDFCLEKGGTLAIIKTVDSFYFALQEYKKLLRNDPNKTPNMAINMRETRSGRVINGDNSAVKETQIYQKGKVINEKLKETVFAVVREDIHDVHTDNLFFALCQPNILSINPY